MLTIDEIESILKDISYKDEDWLVIARENDYMYLQWKFWDGREYQNGRKWVLSEHMTKSEIVSTAFKAVVTFEEHEAREAFTYKGKRIFGPHFDVDVLVEIAGKKKNLDLRESNET